MVHASRTACGADTPELVWTAGMRLQRLVPQMLRHLGALPGRLRQASHAVYEYTPCPPVGYPEIEARGPAARHAWQEAAGTPGLVPGSGHEAAARLPTGARALRHTTQGEVLRHRRCH